MSVLSGRRYLLTGASRGIGALAARELTRRGAKVVGVARDLEALTALQLELKAQAQGALTVRSMDLTARGSLYAWAEALWEELGPFDGLIHNAGVDDFQPSETFDPALLMRQVDLNLTAPMLINRALLPRLLAQGRGALVHMSSVAGYVPTPFGAVYSATKAGLLHYSESLAVEYRETPLSFVSLHPAFVHGSGMHERHKERAGRAPSALGSTTDEEVVAALLKALERSVTGHQGGPVIVSRLPTRPLILLLHAAPRLARWILGVLVRPYLAKVARGAHPGRSAE